MSKPKLENPQGRLVTSTIQQRCTGEKQTPPFVTFLGDSPSAMSILENRIISYHSASQSVWDGHEMRFFAKTTHFCFTIDRSAFE
ncbi:hypothetical protein RND71_018766 [Anisodus tanguticus]|uniref:Uncharacterized protein n=1 Tax=Anisodus tanguticus TaxID=243964 RepID=A0AAE1S4U8_9SOLA|nr:hypothetical protein RND71_018766 [Anisodus tanguticus]